MNTIVPEPWIALDPRLFSKDVIVLALKISNNFRKAVCMSTLTTAEQITWNWGD